MENNFENDIKKPSKRSSVIFIIIMLLCVSAVIIAGYFTLNNTNKVLKNLEPKTVEPNENRLSASDDDNDNADDADDNVNSGKPVSAVQTHENDTEKNNTKDNDKAASANASTSAAVKEKNSDELSKPVSGAMLSPFSIDALVFSKTLEDWRIHSGVDLKCSAGTEVKATLSGRIEDVYFDEMMGKTIVISHEDNMKSIYSNLDEEVSIKKGENVEQGEIIGKAGRTSIAESGEQDHIHFEIIKDGKQIDPYTLINK